MTRFAVDSWAFVEMFFNGPKKAEVEDVLRRADDLVTTREIVAETCNFIIGRARRTNAVWAWLNAIRAGRTRILEHPMGKVENFLRDIGPNSTLGYADASLALAALEEQVDAVATDDARFRELRLNPLFAGALRR